VGAAAVGATCLLVYYLSRPREEAPASDEVVIPEVTEDAPPAQPPAASD